VDTNGKYCVLLVCCCCEPALFQVLELHQIPLYERLRQLETTLLLCLLLLLLQWADSVTAGNPKADYMSDLARRLSSSVLPALKNIQASFLVELPAGAAAPTMMLPLSAAQEQLQLQQHMVAEQKQSASYQCAAPYMSRQQDTQGPAKPLQQQQQQQQECDYLVELPTGMVAEMLPLMIRLWRSRLLLLDRMEAAQRQSASAAAQMVPYHNPPQSARLLLYQYTKLVTELVHASVIKLDHSALTGSSNSSNGSSSSSGTSASQSGTTSAATARAALETAISACGTAIAPHSFLHSRDILTAHAADMIGNLEGVVRFAARDSAWWCHDMDLTSELLGIQGRSTDVAVLLVREAGPRSTDLQRYHSLLASLLKMSVCSAMLHNSPTATWLCDTAVQGAAGLLTQSVFKRQTGTRDQQQPHEVVCHAAGQLPQQQQQQQVDQAQQDQEHTHEQHEQQQAGGDVNGFAAVSVLPSIVIFGRSLLQAVSRLQNAASTGSSGPAVSQPLKNKQQQQQQLDPTVTGAACRVPIAADRELARAELVQQWLEAHGTALAAAGYPVEPILQQLQQLCTALAAVTPANPSGSSTSSFSSGQFVAHSSSSSSSLDTALTAALQQLQQTVSALCCLAVPCLCNNPRCTNISGPTELSLVSGRSCVCRGCRVAHYCCRACQAQHWKQHKPVCTALASAAASAGSPAVS
jgi:hypothetical protein